MALQLLRDLAFTNDPVLTSQLSDTTVLFIPTANPDGRVANIRNTPVTNVDLNRDHLDLRTTEAQAIGQVLRDFRPEITIDAHESPNADTNPPEGRNDLEVLWPRNLNVDAELYTLSREMAEDYLIAPISAAGFLIDVYDEPQSADQRLLHVVAGLRHSLGIIVEAFHGTRTFRVDMHLLAAHEVLRFHRERVSDVVTVATEAPCRKAIVGADQSAPFYLEGTDITPPPPGDVLDPPPTGYRLTAAQLNTISHRAESFAWETEPDGNNWFLTMAQPMMTVIPLIIDPGAHRRGDPIINGIPVYANSYVAIADAHVRGGSFADTNFGTEEFLKAKTWNTEEFTQWSYMKFDLSGVPPGAASHVNLRLFGGMQTNFPEPPVDISVYAVANTSWPEAGITWNNKPALGNVLDTLTVTDGCTSDDPLVTNPSPRWFHLDVTDYIQSELAAGRTTISLAWKVPLFDPDDSKLIMFHSRQHSTHQPYLQILDW